MAMHNDTPIRQPFGSRGQMIGSESCRKAWDYAWAKPRPGAPARSFSAMETLLFHGES
jgi:hypothetical protein